MKYFCILLKSDKKRVDHVISLLNEIPQLTIFPAIEGNTNQLEYYLENREIGNKFLNFCKRGQLACLLSHLEVWKTIVKENINEAVILEDDVKISPGFTDVIIPKDADFAYLYIHPDDKKETQELFVKGYKTFGTVAYYIKKDLAEELILFFNKIRTTVDDSLSWYLEEYKKTYYCGNIVDTIGSLYSRNNNEGIGSAIGKTDLYKNNSGIPSFYIEEEDFLFYPCCNSKNNFYFVSNINKENILKDQKIAGYSSNGWIKKSSENIYIDTSSNLYIKKKKKNKSILLTGGCGYIGSHTALEIIKKYPEYDLVIVDNLSNSSEDVIHKLKIFTDNLFYYNYDITKNIDKLFQYHDIESVIHFAAYKAVGESVENPLKYYSNNIGGLVNLLETMKKYNVENIIFSSSATVYGHPESLPLTEESKTNSLNPYGRTKLFAEEILKDLEKDFKIICLRYFNPVGASQNGLICENPKGIPTNLFPYIIDVIRGKREKLYIFGNDYLTKDGTAIRDYIHVVDLARGHISALNYLLRTDKRYEIFNLGTGIGYSVLEIVNKFSDILGKKIPYEIVDRRKGDSSEVYANCSKALNLLNWKSELNLENMISDSLKKIIYK